MKMKGGRGGRGGGDGTNPDPAAAWKGHLGGFFTAAAAWGQHHLGSPRVAPMLQHFAAAASPPAPPRRPPATSMRAFGRRGR
jgi:hypothetical protein